MQKKIISHLKVNNQDYVLPTKTKEKLLNIFSTKNDYSCFMIISILKKTFYIIEIPADKLEITSDLFLSPFNRGFSRDQLQIRGANLYFSFAKNIPEIRVARFKPCDHIGMELVEELTNKNQFDNKLMLFENDKKLAKNILDQFLNSFQIKAEISLAPKPPNCYYHKLSLSFNQKY